MKRVFSILCVAILLSGFCACSKSNRPTNPETSLVSTSESTTAAQTDTTATTQEATSAQKADISFIYQGYWYQNEGNKVLVLRFRENGEVEVTTYRRKNITASSDEPDRVQLGSFSEKEAGTLTVCPDKDFPQEAYTYSVQSTQKKLFCTTLDPQSGETVTELVQFDTLSKSNAAAVLLGNG